MSPVAVPMSKPTPLSEHERKLLEKRLADLAATLDALSYQFQPPHSRTEQANELQREMMDILGILDGDLVYRKQTDSIKASLEHMRRSLAGTDFATADELHSV
jgi:hypothetical protein